MQDSDSSASMDIVESATAGHGRHTFVLSARRGDSRPVAGEELLVRLQGDGSLAPSSSSAEIRRETDGTGTIRITWYRRSIYGRDVKAKLTVSVAKPGYAISIEETSPEASSTSYDLPGRSKTHL